MRSSKIFRGRLTRAAFTGVRTRGSVLTALIGGTIFIASALAQGATYKLTILAKDGDTIAGQTVRALLPGSVNDSGTVVFSATIGCASGGCSDVFQIPAAGAATQVGAGYGPLLDNNGTVLYHCSSATCANSSVIAKQGDTIGGLTIQQFESDAISGNGSILFVGDAETSASGLFLEQQALLMPTGVLLKTCQFVSNGQASGCFAGGPQGTLIGGMQLRSIGKVAINSTGMIAIDCGFETIATAICTPTAILAQPGSAIGGHTLTSATGPSINKAGMVVFTGGFDSNSVAIFTPSTVVAQPGDAIAGYLLDAVNSPVINDQGTVAFVAHYVSGPNGIPQGWGVFTQSDVVAKMGDTVGGEVISTLKPASINTGGVILLQAGFTDGSTGVILASPDINAGIEVKPGRRAKINSSSDSKIPVAVLSNIAFDAPSMVDRNSLTFGRTGDEASLESCQSESLDVNGDGIADLLCDFDARLTGFQQGDAAAYLKGKTTGGIAFGSAGVIQVLP